MNTKTLDFLTAQKLEIDAQRDYPSHFFSAVKFGRDCKRNRKTERSTLERISGYTGVSIGTLSKVERGSVIAKTEIFLKLCKYYRLSPMDYLSEGSHLPNGVWEKGFLAEQD